MPIVLRSSLEHRVIEHASAHYPVTAEELARALHVSAGRILEELRRMETNGLVELDVLPDKVFVRLLVVAPARGAGGGQGRGHGNERKRQKGGGDDPAYR